MLLASHGLTPPKEWYHDPLTITYKNKTTVAMKLAESGVIPPKEWEHDSRLSNNYGNTVALLLSYFGIIPPK